VTLRLVFTAILLMFLVAACGGDGAVTDSTEGPSSSTLGSVPSTTVTTVVTTTMDSTTTTTTLPATTTSTIAGRVVQFGPALDDVLGVVGVRHDDTLNLRVGPGVSEPVLDTVEPTFGHLVAKGQTRMLPNGSLWIEVDHAGVVGWVHLSFVAYIGSVHDATAFVVAALGEYPTTTSMEEMALMVAGVFAFTESASRVVMTVEPTMGDLGEVTYDVVGLEDDATFGFRLHVLGQTVSDGLSLHSVERTELCARGVAEDGFCI
jgi:hypothetical protein